MSCLCSFSKLLLVFLLCVSHILLVLIAAAHRCSCLSLMRLTVTAAHPKHLLSACSKQHKPLASFRAATDALCQLVTTAADSISAIQATHLATEPTGDDSGGSDGSKPLTASTTVTVS